MKKDITSVSSGQIIVNARHPNDSSPRVISESKI